MLFRSQHWREAYALSTELVKEFYQQNPSKLLTPERLVSFAQEILSQGLEKSYISRDSDISEVLSEETDPALLEGIFYYAAKNYLTLSGS